MTTVRDDLGRTLNLNLPARRIVSLAPVATENLFAIGAGANVVGVTSADDYPPAALKLPRVGDFYVPLLERIHALRPDLVLVDSATVKKGDMDNLQDRLKIPVFAQLSKTLADIARHLTQLGYLTDHKPQAAHVNAILRHKIELARRRVAGKARVKVFIEVSRSPLYAAGPGSFMDDLLQTAGGINIVRGTNSFPQYSKEALIAGDPDFYIVPIGKISDPRAATALPPPLNRLRAARLGQVRTIPADLVLRSTPRVADGLLMLVTLLHSSGATP